MDLDELMDNDENVFMMGEDIGVFEGALKPQKDSSTSMDHFE
jgi:pyruvate/2-oxoglutarate/acetoin dehydrogenase E1 component